jgi:hypothetical protein
MLNRRPKFRPLGGLAIPEPPPPLGPPAFAVGDTVVYQGAWFLVDASTHVHEHIYFLKYPDAPSPTTRIHAREHELSRPSVYHRRKKAA